MAEIDTIQEWMQTALICRGDLPQKLLTANTMTNLVLEDVIVDKKGVSAKERFDIYASGYVLRLLECLRGDFEKVRVFMTDSLFDTFAKAYILTIPSTSWDLYDLGDKFSDFLLHTKPNEDIIYILPALIAQIERAYTKALQEKGVEQTVQKSIDFFDILNKDINIKCADTLKLIKQDYDMYDLYNNIKPLYSTNLPNKEITYLAIARKNYYVSLYKLTDWQYYFLHFCKNHNPNEAIKLSAKEANITEAKQRTNLMFWLPIAFDLCFITSSE